ncbi:diacylglycerol/lipid kinase family protein [Mesobacterium pallidum]|uniref:diacylglycerol/lipid kinase family protein n=1 Tax=Mesobacterium pallidum TaxID=2872037 RepID=UPI001EE2A983|nr:diacylglycerol kinase family protein [Mesobacterium pallidum]
MRAETSFDTGEVSPATAPSGPFVLIANRKSGTNSRDRDALDRACAVLGDDTRLETWDAEGGEDLGAVVAKAIDSGAGCIVAAGGDGTAMAVADALLGTGVPMGCLPLGTFNYFARGLGLSEDPEEAARALKSATPVEIEVGTVGGHVFLNNASLGIYPAILKERESIYARWGRRRIMAHWSVVRTFWQFQRPMRLHLDVDGAVHQVRSPLVFVARSAYQLERFNLAGAEAISDDRMAVLIGRADSRWGLFKLTWRLVTRRMRQGRDYDLLPARKLLVETTRKRALVAYDGEKRRAAAPFDFAMSGDKRLTILLPEADPRTP